MTLDEDAAKVVIAAEDKLLLAIFGGQQEEIIDFLENSLLPRYARRCAEQMREECAKVAKRYWQSDVSNVAYCIAEDIQQMKVK